MGLKFGQTEKLKSIFRFAVVWSTQVKFFKFVIHNYIYQVGEQL